jgi:NAD(P)-dependent dehydrogenase (short-subunit alcohol dehydrogenase family)
MKVAVTGHSGGLGKAIADRLARDGHEIVGFSLDNGYDLSTPDGFRRIVNEALECDVFVNCAHDRKEQGIGQTNILIKLFNHWQKEEKHIISIGSNAPDVFARAFDARASKYRAAKSALDAAHLQISSLWQPCRVSIVRPNWINSQAAADAEAKTGVTLAKLEYEEVADVVAMIVDMGPEVTIQSITLTRTFQRGQGQSRLKKWLRRRL